MCKLIIINRGTTITIGKQMQSQSIVSFSKMKHLRYLRDLSDSNIMQGPQRYQSYNRQPSPLRSLPMDAIGQPVSTKNRHIRSITVAEDYQEEPMPPLVVYRNHSRSPRQKIEQMHHEEVLRNRAKHFIAKVRKQKEYNEGKLMLKRKEQEIKRLEKIKEDQEMERERNQNERMKRRFAAEERIRENLYRNQLREENRQRKDANSIKTESESRQSSSKNNISKSVKLHAIQQIGPKTPQQSQYFSTKLKTEATAMMFKSNRKDRLPAIPSKQPVPKASHRSNSKIDENLQKYIYLTAQEGRKIEQIKKKIDQLNKLG